MFRLYHSNDLDVLKGLLLNEIRQNPPGVFDAEQILVQSQGMAHWLKLQLADGLGIAAQIEFPLPSAYVWKVFNTLKPELPERSHFEKQAMAWKLMRLLPECRHEPGCEAIDRYLQDDPHGLKVYELAHEVADVFDQYLVYRPDWLLTWESGSDTVDDTDVRVHPWQPRVWRTLVADSRRLGNSLEHRARLTTSLSDIVAEHGDRLSAMPKRLFVFGIAALPGAYWDVLNAISSHIDVHFFLLNPCRNFWGDIVSDRQKAWMLKHHPHAEHYLERGNPMLASWGRLGKDFLTLVHETSATQERFDIEAYADVDRTTLLAHLKADILDLVDAQAPAYRPDSLQHSQFKHAISASDDSVRVISAHSPLREVQRLHDQLLHWFQQDTSLKPRDIVVMVPDIDQYAPYIDAVFASAPEAQRIPWAIADQSQVQENPLLESVMALMGLFDNRLSLTQVLDWLDVPAIRRRFGLDESDLESIKDWLNQAGVRWGLDNAHRQSLGFPGFDQNSWRKGLRQLLLGLMLPDATGKDNASAGTSKQGNDWPVYAVEGGAAELLGQLMCFIDTLDHWRQFQASATDHAVETWMQAIPAMLDDFYDPDLDEGVQLQRVRDALQRWSQELSDADFNQSLSAHVVRTWFNEHLGQQGGWQRFLAGPVNFCTLMPMRSIPFKAVCLLGMNDQDYPRQVTPVGFDLMVQGQSRRGDRSRREDDRYLVLEALCSAQDKLYISYRGRDARENHELQPSVLINELLDYIGDGYCLEGDEALPASVSRERLRAHLIEALPLQPFHRRTFEAKSTQGVAGYHGMWAAVANASDQASEDNDFYHQPVPLPEGFTLQQVLWSDVKDALLKPASFFLKRRLRVSPDRYDSSAQNEEIFTPDNLDNSILKTRWMNECLTAFSQGQIEGVGQSRQQVSQAFTRREHALGHLPVNTLGDLHAESLVRDISPLADAVERYIHGPAESGTVSIELDYDHSPCEIVGDYGQLWGGFLLHWRSGDIRGEHLLSGWLDLVLLAAAQPGKAEAVVVLGGEKSLQEIRLRAPTPEQAQAYIRQCLKAYVESWQAPQTALPNLLWDVMNSDDAEKTLNSHRASEYSELNKTAAQRCYPELGDWLSAGADVAGLNSKAACELDDWLAEHRWRFDLLIQHQANEESQEQES